MFSYHPHHTDEKTEAKKDKANCLHILSEVVKLGENPVPVTPEAKFPLLFIAISGTSTYRTKGQPSSLGLSI